MPWYQIKTATYGDSSPFGGGELTERSRTSPYGFAGGDEKTGNFAASEGEHSANDYFSESDHTPSIEKEMEEQRKKRLKRKRLKRRPLYQQDIQVTNAIEDTLQATITVFCYNNGVKSDSGSGFFISPNIVLTCAHVLGGKETTISYNGKQYPCSVWAKDDNLDVAAITVNDKTFRNDRYLKLGDSGNTAVGDEIIVVGTPLGFDNIVGKGIVSSKEKSYVENGVQNYFHFISADIVAGNSGGPVVRFDSGAALGIAAATLDDPTFNSGGLNAMIPINRIKGFLKKNGINYEDAR